MCVCIISVCSDQSVMGKIVIFMGWYFLWPGVLVISQSVKTVKKYLAGVKYVKILIACYYIGII